jgi:L-ascorbate metabolism protein UlaG (beta-lactamase superfamily)
MRRLLPAILLAALLTTPASVSAQEADTVPELGGRAAMVEARTTFFGRANVDQRTGAVRRGRVILSWFGVSSFAMAIDGRVVLLDAWVPRGQTSGYVPTTPAQVARLRPRLIFIGHGHFDHAADATPIALAAGARIVGTGEHCSDLRARVPGRRARCVAAVPTGAPPGTLRRARVLPGVAVTALEHVHSAQTPSDGRHEPVPLVSSDNAERFPPRPQDAAHLQRHLSDPMGGAMLYRFAVRGFELVWHDSAGPLVDRAPGVLRVLRRLGPVDVQVGAIQGFNQFTNGMRDPRTYIEALRPRTFVPNHHDDWFPPGLSMPAARYEPYLRRQLARIPAARRPGLRWLEDRGDYLAPGRVTFRLARRS